jgi:toxin ParE1/3/4
MRIEWSPDAVSDLRTISEYIEQDRSLETANRVARLIYDSIQNLRTMPNRGRKGRVESTRELVVSSLPYIVVYRVSTKRLLILNIVHGAQRWP